MGEERKSRSPAMMSVRNGAGVPLEVSCWGSAWRGGAARVHAAGPGSPDPELVEQGSPYGVVLVVADAGGDEVGLVGGDGGQPDGEVGELVVEPGPQGGGGGGVGGLQCRSAGDLVVQGGVAELAGVGGG